MLRLNENEPVKASYTVDIYSCENTKRPWPPKSLFEIFSKLVVKCNLSVHVVRNMTAKSLGSMFIHFPL